MPDFSIEDQYQGRIAGIDEVGRGPLAGPVVAAAVILPRDERLPVELLSELNDSKKLSVKKRDHLYAVIMNCAEVGIGAASVREIDQINILQATYVAMRRAVSRLGALPDQALVDGNRDPGLPCAVETVVKGDSKSLSIAAASIVAKVVRDRAMARLATRYPFFGWEGNAGYGVKKHMAGLGEVGPTAHHRKSFKPIADLFDAMMDGR
ncbi:ribonuclease HII [Thalassospira sp. A40-3]|uniref:ribonuclease HII n=1 Tax=unclassified Thalassospira TaxID=2648997 RepID=UPI0018CD26F0|nr:ribonuclease HII [Thalassospira sp. A40-3]QPO11288.1 ribonuclease HII [Thalassospira sp. A40-3]